ncbi:unnamed protein product [Aspergillus oryzae]|nr:unnamed protein product [Aspergillus oryzae]
MCIRPTICCDNLTEFCPDELALFIGVPFDVFGEIRNNKEPGKRDDTSDQAFDDKDPAPASVATSTIHLSKPASQQATEGARKCG